MKCTWYADFEGVCTNDACPYRGDVCPTSEYPEVCKYAEAAPEVLKLKSPRLSAKELAKTLRLCDSTSCVGCALFEFVDCGSAAKQQAADMLEKLAAEKDAQKPEWIEQQRTAISAIETCRQLKKSLFGKENVTNDELVRIVLQLKSGRWMQETGGKNDENA
jgi:hypothetical protein|nr:MAG TPA: hypothetical protein [Caudoviricetes sp.]